MPLFVTVTPGTTVTSSTTLDAATLNLLGTPSVDITGSVDGGSLTLAPGSVTNSNLYAMAATTVKANPSGTSATPTDVVVDSTTMAIDAISGLRVKTNGVQYANIQQVAASSLLGNPTGSAANVSGITLGTNLSFAGAVLNAASSASNMKLAGYSVLNSTQTIAGSSGWTDITNLSITTPTPQSSSSKFLLFAVVSGSTTKSTSPFEAGAFRFLKGSTAIGIGTGGTGSMVAATASGIGLASNAVSLANSATLLYVDAPASATAVTYKVQGMCYQAGGAAGSGNLVINRDYTSSAVATISYFVVVEVI